MPKELANVEESRYSNAKSRTTKNQDCEVHVNKDNKVRKPVKRNLGLKNTTHGQNFVDGLNSDIALIEREAQAKELAKDFGVNVAVVEDIETRLSFLETPIPPFLSYNEETGVLVCDDPVLARFIRLVTNGNPVRIKNIIESRNTRRAIIRDTGGWLRLRLLALYVDQAMQAKPSDPAKRALEIVREYQPDQTRKPASSKKPEKPEAPKPDGTARDILGMGKTGKAYGNPADKKS